MVNERQANIIHLDQNLIWPLKLSSGGTDRSKITYHYFIIFPVGFLVFYAGSGNIESLFIATDCSVWSLEQMGVNATSSQALLKLQSKSYLATLGSVLAVTCVEGYTPMVDGINGSYPLMIQCDSCTNSSQ